MKIKIKITQIEIKSNFMSVAAISPKLESIKLQIDFFLTDILSQ